MVDDNQDGTVNPQAPPYEEAPAVIPAPLTAEPVAPPPLTAEPVAPPPLTAEPVAPVPLAAEPVTPPPLAAEPVAPPPLAAEPVVPVPLAAEPVAPPPLAAEPVAPPPLTAEPVAPPPLAAEPVAPPPLAAEPVAPAPLAAEPVAPVPLAAEPVAPPPLTAEPVVEEDKDKEDKDKEDKDKEDKDKEDKDKKSGGKYSLKGKKKLIIAASIIVILLLGAGGGGYYYLMLEEQAEAQKMARLAANRRALLMKKKQTPAQIQASRLKRSGTHTVQGQKLATASVVGKSPILPSRIAAENIPVVEPRMKKLAALPSQVSTENIPKTSSDVLANVLTQKGSFKVVGDSSSDENSPSSDQLKSVKKEAGKIKKLEPLPKSVDGELGVVTPVAGGGSAPSAAEKALLKSTTALDSLNPDDIAAMKLPILKEGYSGQLGRSGRMRGRKVTDILSTPAEIRPLPQKYLVVQKEHDAEDVNSRLTAARSALTQGRSAAALALFNDLYIEDPKDGRVLMGRAVAMQKLGQISESLSAYEDVLNNDPKNIEALTNMLGLLKGQDQVSVLKKLKQLREVYPYNADVTAQLGMVYGVMGDYTKAVKYLDMADALKPGNASIIYNRAVVYDRIGESTKATALYRQIIAMSVEGSLQSTFPIARIRKRLATIR